MSNFSYPLFLELNRHGRFIIILDGFDEMKHAMSFQHFRVMMNEFKGLIVKNSKVLILGRPSIFTSEDEQQSVLSGTRKLGDKEIRSVELAKYDQIDVANFDNDQLSKFVGKYLDHLFEEKREEISDDIDDEFVARRKLEIVNQPDTDLIAKPVHARMLCTIAISTTDDLSSINRFALYNTFLEMFYEREMEKKSRQDINSSIRVDFIESLSWSLWKKRGANGFTYEDIESLAKPTVTEQAHYQDILRELVIGSVFERKAEGYYYFSHRSFQEYYVAEYLSKKKLFSSDEVRSLLESISSEIIQFIEESARAEQSTSNIFLALNLYTGDISVTLIEFLRLYFKNRSMKFIELSPWQAFIKAYSYDVTKSGATGEHLSLINEVKASIVLGYALNMGNATQVTAWTNFFVSTLVGECARLIDAADIHQNKLKTNVALTARQSFWIKIALESITPLITASNEVTKLRFDHLEFINSLLASLEGRVDPIGISYTALDGPIDVSIDLLDSNLLPYLTRDSDPKLHLELSSFKKKHRNFWRCKPTVAQFVHVETVKERREIIKLPAKRNRTT